MKTPLQYWLKKRLSLFDRLPLSVKFLLAFLLPVAAVVWMSVANGLELYQTSRSVEQLELHTNLAVEAGYLVGSIQRERGFSIIFLESERKRLQEQLVITRRSTDKHIDSLLEKLRQVEARSGFSDFTQSLNALTGSLSEITEVRRDIDSGFAQTASVNDIYTRYIEAFNNQVSVLSSQTDQSQIGRKLNAYFILNRLRELLGKERSLVSQALINGQISDESVRALIYLAGRQENAQIGFKTQTPITKPYHSLTIDSAATTFREQLVAAPNRDVLLQSLSVKEWFRLQSERMNNIRAIEDELAKDILTDTAELLTTAKYQLWRYLIISPLALLSGLFLALLIFRHTQARIGLIETVFEHTHDRITVTDRSARIVEVNDAFTRITGYSREEVIGKNPRILQSGRQDQDFYTNLWHELKKIGTWQGEIWNRHKNGELYAELTTINAVRNSRGCTNYYVAISSEITDRAVEHNRQLEHRAYHDPLTGLPNQELLRDRLEHALKLSKRSPESSIIVACTDLDHFKKVNDEHGHDFGDRLLELVAKRMSALLRDGDSLARTGGDEFLIIFENLKGAYQAEQILERLRQELSSALNLSGIQVTLATSIGATSFPDDDADADTLIRHATEALHEAKHNGRGQVAWFDQEKERNQNALLELLRKLEHALTNNELRLYYQPKVNMVTGELIGAEALLRWQDPKRGLVPPGEFLPMIEQHPFSINIGNWVIETALSQIENWQKSMGFAVTISVNINALQLLTPGFLTSLQNHLNRHPGLNPQNLELEVLESAAINDIHRAGEVLRECRQLGIGVSLDDFGTGYAALEYLKRLPAECLKIDQTFVRDMQTDAGDRAIVKGIIGLADAFGFGVIAEGVETEEQGCMLIGMGCTAAQGYGIARPMPAEQFQRWIETWQRPDSWRS